MQAAAVAAASSTSHGARSLGFLGWRSESQRLVGNQFCGFSETCALNTGRPEPSVPEARGAPISPSCHSRAHGPDLQPPAPASLSWGPSSAPQALLCWPLS